MFAAGIVNVVPEKLPKLAGFPVSAEFASVHVTAVSKKLGLAASVTVTTVPRVATFRAVGEAGAATFADAVEIFAGVEARLVCVKLNGPPAAPRVIFLNATVAGIGVFVKVHAIASL